MPFLNKKENDLKLSYYILLSGFLLSCLLVWGYSQIKSNVLLITYGDSWIYTDLAKRIAYTFSLHMDQVFDLIYPPLYSLILSIAYISKNHSLVFKIIKSLNIILFSTSFIPYFLLLKNYSKIPIKHAFIGALFLVMAPWAITYSSALTSEAIYFPLVAWLCWFLASDFYFKNKTSLFIFSLSLVSLPLTKVLGLVFIASFACTVFFVFLLNYKEKKLYFLKSCSALSISIAILILYKIYLTLVIPTGSTDATGGYLVALSNPLIFKISYWYDRFRFNYFWTITRSGTLAVLMVGIIFINNFKKLIKDPVVLFTFFLSMFTLLIVTIFMSTEPLGIPHPRYFVPLIFLFIIILFKYFHLYSFKDFMFCSSIMILNKFFGMSPFPDWLKNKVSIQSFSIIECIFIFIVSAALFLLFHFKNKFINLFLILMLVSTPLAFLRNKDSTIFNNFSDPFESIANLTYQNIFIDNSWRNTNFETWSTYESIMMNTLSIPIFKNISEARSFANKDNSDVFFLSHNVIGNAQKIKSWDNLSLYKLNKKN